ncbi:unnamed protein product [Anisakis simplex]|uniref:Palmitoyltransferase n=1 Tax=Anisakis simplex TaxID=6269 RepID=A0A0M3JE22_ANISI|nr:unnamed protein product [Anisakis simplex]
MFSKCFPDQSHGVNCVWNNCLGIQDYSSFGWLAVVLPLFSPRKQGYSSFGWLAVVLPLFSPRKQGYSSFGWLAVVLPLFGPIGAVTGSFITI